MKTKHNKNKTIQILVYVKQAETTGQIWEEKVLRKAMTQTESQIPVKGYTNKLKD